jgi:hypothetical protein
MRNASLFPASYSKLSTYETCAAKVKFRYIEKVPSKKGPAAERGTKFHSSIEGYLLGEKTTLHREVASIKSVVMRVAKLQPVIEQKMALKHDLLTPVDWKSPEAHFRLVIDCAYTEPTKAYVQEWKSGKVYEDHASQRRIYGMGALILWPNATEAEVTTYYIDQKHNEPLLVKRPELTLMAWQLQQRLEKMAEDKWFAPRPGKYCFWCDYSKKKGGPCKIA